MVFWSLYYILSKYASIFVSVCQRDGTIRLCCDYRHLNLKTIPNCYPLFCIQDLIDQLGRNQCFKILDQNKTYHQFHLDPDSQMYTASVTRCGNYEWVHVPSDLMNAPGCFQSFMEQCLNGNGYEFVILYLDGLLIYPTFD